DGGSALKLAASEKPDLILLDIMMPGIDGHEVCRRLKADESTRDIPIIFITAKDDEEDESEGLGLGAVDYITKPFSSSIVLARVRTHLILKKAMEDVASQNAALREADRMKEDVNRIMRHDLKAPLNAIIGFSSFLLDSDKFEGPEREYLSIINESGYTLLNMIDLSLDLYKMENGIYQLKPVPIDITTILRKIIKLHETEIISRHLVCSIVQDPAASLASSQNLVLGEELLCYSLFANLMKNAFEASPKHGEIRVTIRSRAGELEISIHNTGEVPEEIREKFFEKYVTSGKPHGTGLGTYSARLITETQHGSIRMESSPGGGTTVSVRLPTP
ncbi:MAG: hybrid sensor histidine kinase/response regulator, partial [Magnetococcales bacterium]|nr:hybrid sensor histidine kinase/response regulator [Magnetococcales bacterium]